MKKILALCVAVAVFCAAILLLPTGEDYRIYDTVLRLHVLANSDSEEDQARKLAVRDGLLAFLEQPMQGCESKKQAKQVVLENEAQILQVCHDTLRENGSSEKVSIRLVEEYYPTRQYDDMSLPAGEYLSLQVCIGEAKGQNWWCVLYPPVCLGVSSAKDKLKQAGVDDAQVKLVSEDRDVRYAVKFKILETVGSFFSRLF